MRWLSLLVLAMLAACGPEGPQPTVTDLMDADRAFDLATAEQGVEGWVSWFAEDGVMYDGARPVVGRDSILAAMAPMLDSAGVSLTWQPEAGELSASGDLGYTRGRWQRRVKAADGTETTATGSYVTIWRKMPDGTWKVAVDIGNPDEQ
jgi:ketosteroid isomerase-like protein